MENAERALQHVAVLDKKRKPTGEYRYDGSVANRALELLGKQQGMFIDRNEVGQPNEFANWTDEELKAFIKRRHQALMKCDAGLNRHGPRPKGSAWQAPLDR
jgi:hypothetical protein